MMEALAQYIYSVSGAGLICAVLRHMTKATSQAGICRLLTGVFMLLTLLLPLGDIHFDGLPAMYPDVSLEAERAVSEGKESYQNALAQSISHRTQAYILDKGARLGVSLTVQVELSKDPMPVPVRVRLSGNVSPYAKSRLQQILANELGIPKEDQIWT